MSADGLLKLQQAGAQRILVLPLFPQYSGAATGAVYDQVAAELHALALAAGAALRRPTTTTIPGYTAALRDSIQSHWQQHGRTGHLLMSFHGIPEAYFDKGDPVFSSNATAPRGCSPMNCCSRRGNGA